MALTLEDASWSCSPGLRCPAPPILVNTLPFVWKVFLIPLSDSSFVVDSKDVPPTSHLAPFLITPDPQASRPKEKTHLKQWQFTFAERMDRCGTPAATAQSFRQHLT